MAKEDKRAKALDGLNEAILQLIRIRAIADLVANAKYDDLRPLTISEAMEVIEDECSVTERHLGPAFAAMTEKNHIAGKGDGS